VCGDISFCCGGGLMILLLVAGLLSRTVARRKFSPVDNIGVESFVDCAVRVLKEVLSMLIGFI
jgi:hypothetical protein